jgi:hypothetical protein
MARRMSISFVQLRQRAWRRVLELSDVAGDCAPPVPLNEIATRLSIRGVEFLPLVSTAGVGPVEDGYGVYINTRAPGAAPFGRSCLHTTREDFDRLSAPLRFTVAHEMAHVLFFELLGGDCENQLLRKHWRALEHTCNQMARVLLLPKKPFLRELGGDLFSLQAATTVIRRYRVSPDVFIFRFRVADIGRAFDGHDEGLIAYIKDRVNGPRIMAAHSLGTVANIRWPVRNWRSGRIALDKLYLSIDVEALLRTRHRGVVDAEVLWRDDQMIPCKVEVWPFPREPIRGVVSIRLTGHP